MSALARVEERIRETWKATLPRHGTILPRFVAAVEKVGGVILEAREPRAVGISIAALAKARGVSLCQTADPDLAAALGLETAMAEAGIACATGPTPEAIAHAGIGITIPRGNRACRDRHHAGRHRGRGDRLDPRPSG